MHLRTRQTISDTFLAHCSGSSQRMPSLVLRRPQAVAANLHHVPIALQMSKNGTVLVIFSGHHRRGTKKCKNFGRCAGRLCMHSVLQFGPFFWAGAGQKGRKNSMASPENRCLGPPESHCTSIQQGFFFEKSCWNMRARKNVREISTPGLGPQKWPRNHDEHYSCGT